MSRKAVRFAVVDEVAGKHSGAWRIWAHGDDVYITPVELGDRVKVSLHSGVWRVAFAREHWETGLPPNNAPGPGRSVWEVEHLPEVRSGVQHAWFIAFPPETLIRTDSLGARIEQIKSPNSDHLIIVNIWLCEQTVDRRPEFPIPPSPLSLADGRLVWVGRDLGPYERATRPRRPIVGSLIEFSRPESPGGTPGFVMRPVDVA